MAAVAFTYNGSDTITATITGATPSQAYALGVEDGAWAGNGRIGHGRDGIPVRRGRSTVPATDCSNRR